MKIIQIVLCILLLSFSFADITISRSYSEDYSGKGNIKRPIGLRATGTHDVGNIELVIDDTGGQEGWRWTHKWPIYTSIDHLYWNWLAIAYSLTNVSDGWDGDWATTPGGGMVITEPGAFADEQGYAQFHDMLNDIEVTQESYAWANPPDDDYVIVKYSIKNIGTITFQSLYVGHRSDFDVLGDHGGAITDMSDFDASRNLGYMWDIRSAHHVGVKLLEGVYRGYRNTGWYSGSEDEKYFALSEPGADPQTPYASDWCFWLSAGSFQLDPGDSVIVAFAFLGGDSLQNLQTNADTAQEKWHSLEITEKKIILIKNNRFGTTIVSGPLFLPDSKSYKVFDITGRIVEPAKIKPGVYFIEVNGEIAQKLIKIR